MTFEKAESEVSEEKAAEVLLEANRKRLEAFEEAYRKLCVEHGFEKVPTVGLTEDGRIGANLRTIQLRRN